jgi:hypothetical protein
MFQVGQMVVCVDDSPGKIGHGPCHLIKNNVYTIAGFYDTVQGPLGIAIEEVDPTGEKCLYDRRRFRPARKTDISVFQKFLAPVDA